MEQIIEILVGALAQVLVIIIGAVAGFAGMKVKNFYNQKEIKETIENNKIIVGIAVDFAEQTYKALDGSEKFEKAKDKAVAMMNERGIPVKEEEIDAMIEQAVLSFKNSTK
jgi:hypothetical protein